MGYCVKFSRCLKISPPLSKEQVAYLQRFSEIRHVYHHSHFLETNSKVHDPLREAVGLPVGKNGAYFVGYFEHEGLSEAKAQGIEIDSYYQDPESIPSVQNPNHPSPLLPGLFCGWTVSDNGRKLIWDGREKFRYFSEWLIFLQNHFFKPWNKNLNGYICWSGEDKKDKGFLVVNADQSISTIDRYTPEGDAFIIEQKRIQEIKKEKKHLQEVLPESSRLSSRKMKL